ncbi:MAG TPA: TlpA disulfide reductase family protein [Macellibacteroides fermentans]|uniref:redoxin domain-containing protein n=1 Tax=Macellibacteroides fermentans TaxID=879969 RepID=UPI002C26504F|nr:TlpA disulfide reductase family protein [Macellibacteroides fermentans]
MKKFLFLAASAIALISCSTKPSYQLTGKVAGANFNGKYVYMYEFGVRDAAPLDSALVQEGAFLFKGDQASPALRVIRFSQADMESISPRQTGPGQNRPYSATIVLENAPILVTLDTVSVVAGTIENEAIQAFTTEMEKINAEEVAFASSIGNFDSLTAEAKAEVEKKSEALFNRRLDFAGKYASENPTKLSGAYVFRSFSSYLDEAVQQEIIAKADSTFKAVPGIDRVIARLEVLGKVAVGQKFTDFEMADMEGNMHKLSEYVGQGKIVLIDFWASWCPPCRKEMPALVELYKKYNKKGFEIVGVSLDKDKDAWVEGVKNMHMEWKQLSDLKFWESEGAALYGVNSIPHTVLVDKDGTILAKNLHGEELNTKLAELIK